MFAGMCLSTGGFLLPGVHAPGGVAVAGGLVPGGLLWGGLVPGMPGGDPPTATAVGGKHPTGMHSCF